MSKTYLKIRFALEFNLCYQIKSVQNTYPSFNLLGVLIGSFHFCLIGRGKEGEERMPAVLIFVSVYIVYGKKQSIS